MRAVEALELLNNIKFAEEYQGKDEYTEMLSVCKSVLEKHIPKKVKYFYGIPVCPSCNYDYPTRRFCDKCSQALDWEENNNGIEGQECSI